MTERKKRVRVVVKEMITDELLRLFRKAITAELALQGKEMSVAEDKAALADYHAFHQSHSLSVVRTLSAAASARQWRVARVADRASRQDRRNPRA